jgi:Na+/melibiose symporter-like transporter
MESFSLADKRREGAVTPKNLPANAIDHMKLSTAILAVVLSLTALALAQAFYPRSSGMTASRQISREIEKIDAQVQERERLDVAKNHPLP